MIDTAPVIVWFRRDLRLSDHPALVAALETGRPIIPVYICDESVETLGAAPKWRLGLGIDAFSKSLEKIKSRLILRKGDALASLQSLIAQTGATDVYWTRAYDRAAIARDTAIKSALKGTGVNAQSFGGHVIFEPWTVETKTGGFYKVYSPMWKSVMGRDVGPVLPTITQLNAPEHWPASDDLKDWNLGAAMNRGASIVAPYTQVGEAAAHDRLARFLDGPVQSYKEKRDFPNLVATSGLSENFAYGEISPRVVWYAGWDAVHRGAQGAEHFVKEVVWREFAYHLIYHTPHIEDQNWRPEWDAFEWRPDGPDAEKWRRGMTGEPFVDAGMRELYVTGTMHNRVRMIVGSYLTKHLRLDWRIGKKWFEECLIDWDPAANAMGWQWIAGCGPDAAPYFRVFNPATQAEKFDKSQEYRGRFLNNWSLHSEPEAQKYFQAVPKSWGMSKDDAYPEPMIELSVGRQHALSAYSRLREKRDQGLADGANIV